MPGMPSAEDWDRRYAGKELVWSAEPNRFVAAALGDEPPGRALDLAAGEGRNAVWLAERGWRVTAVDFSPVALEKGRELAAASGVDIDWIQADLAGWTPPAEHFDAVLLAYLHLPSAQLEPVLAGAASALTPGGRLVAVGHHRDNLEEGVGGPQDPAVLQTVEGLVNGLLAGVPDLVLERAERVLRPVDTPDGERSAIDVLVVARRAVGR
jgi:SAM-dependent methyltransferase